MNTVFHVASFLEETEATTVELFRVEIPEGQVILMLTEGGDLEAADLFSGKPVAVVQHSAGTSVKLSKNPKNSLVSLRSLNVLGFWDYGWKIFIYWNSHRMGVVLVQQKKEYGGDIKEAISQIRSLVKSGLAPNKALYMVEKGGL